MMRLMYVLIAILFLLSACSQTDTFDVTIESVIGTNTTKIAFFGDQGIESGGQAVLELVKSQSADAVVVLGDFGYEERSSDTPSKWMAMYDRILGEDFLIIGAIGNHDVSHWELYKDLLQAKIANTTICEGEYGVNMYCTIGPVGIVLSGVGTFGSGHEAFIESQLNQSATPWNICGWHKNQHLMQTGGKKDEVGWSAYEICRLYGAPVFTGHEHAYSRTYLLDSFENQSVVSFENDMYLSSGQSFAVVSGLGGKSIRNQNKDVPNQDWWASVYTTSQDAQPGALFCSFANDFAVKEALCEFITIDGTVVDSFKMIRE